MGDLHHDRSPVGHGHRESASPAARRSTRTWAPSARSATRSASASRVTSEGSGVKQVHILGRSIHQIMGEHRATTGQGNLPGLRERERDRRDLLMQRVQTHDATTPSRGSQTCRTCGGSHRRATAAASS
jgi:hypothetical protein